MATANRLHGNWERQKPPWQRRSWNPWNSGSMVGPSPLRGPSAVSTEAAMPRCASLFRVGQRPTLKCAHLSSPFPHADSRCFSVEDAKGRLLAERLLSANCDSVTIHLETP